MPGCFNGTRVIWAILIASLSKSSSSFSDTVISKFVLLRLGQYGRSPQQNSESASTCSSHIIKDLAANRCNVHNAYLYNVSGGRAKLTCIKMDPRKNVYFWLLVKDAIYHYQNISLIPSHHVQYLGF